MLSRNIVKKILKASAYKIISLEALLSRKRKARLHGKAIVLMYHEIANDEDEIDAWTVVRKRDFLQQMEYLSNHFRVVSLRDAIAHMTEANGGAEQKPMAVVTFDDGYAGNRQVLLPIVKDMNLPVTIFIATRAIQDQGIYWYDRVINGLQGEQVIDIDLTYSSLGKYRINASKGSENWREMEKLLSDLKTLEPDKRENVVDDILSDVHITTKRHSYHVAPLTIHELRELSECPLVTIGAHSHCHNLLTQLQDYDIGISVNKSKQLIESWIERPIHYFAYPNGNYNDTVINMVKKSGLQCGLTTVARPWKMGESLFAIPRVGIGRYDSFDLFKIKVSGGRA
ncbi:MAG: polysaccharide deacetylase family protein [Nitrospirae bacterium]|nr:polysaccharide deacetylase family protein [Nitrospirota bacterium]